MTAAVCRCAARHAPARRHHANCPVYIAWIDAQHAEIRARLTERNDRR